MRQIRITALIALAAILASCNRNGAEIQSPDNYITASIEKVGTPQTKAIMQDNPGVSMNVYWQKEDHIGIFGEGGSNVDFVLSEASLKENGQTAIFQTNETMPKGNLLAYYPYAKGIAESNGALSFTAPDTQHYTYAKGLQTPDPAANVMVAKGTRASGLLFQPVHAILKIGKIFDEDVSVKSVEFKDLDGKPVSGAFTVSFKDGKPAASFTGTGTTLKLDCGNLVNAKKGEAKIFYLMVPARSYPKGYEITFVTGAGTRITQTVGATMGRTLQPATIYPVGDITEYDKTEGITTETFPEAVLLDHNKLDKIQLVSKNRVSLKAQDGSPLYNPDMSVIQSYELELLVHKDLNPKVGGWLVFDETSDVLPNGGVFRISTCARASDTYFKVEAVPEVNPLAAFKKLEIGKEGEEIPINMNGFIKEITDKDGKPIDFNFDSDGKLVFSYDAVQQMTSTSVEHSGTKSGTKAILKKIPSSFSLPDLSITAKAPNAEATFTPQLTTEVQTAIGAVEGELQYAVLKISPTISMEAEFALKASASVDKDWYLFGIKTTPIPIGGILIYFEMEVYAKIGVGGELVFSTTISSSQDLGTYTISYNHGDGFITKKTREAGLAGYNMSDPSISGNGSISVYGGFTLASSVNIYGVLSMGLATDFLVSGTIKNEYEGLKDKGLKFELGPGIEISPRIAVNFLGFKWAHRFDELTFKVNMDPWYEAYIIPAAETSVTYNWNYSPKTYRFTFPDDALGYSSTEGQVKTGLQSFHYKAELEGKCEQDLDLGIAIYEVLSNTYTYGTKTAELEHKYYQAAGCPMNVSSVYIKDPNLKFVAFEPIGTYKKGTKAQTFEGDLRPNYIMSSGKRYCTLISWAKEGKVKYAFGYGYYSTGQRSMANYAYFSWPNDPKGNEYVDAYADAQHEGQ